MITNINAYLEELRNAFPKYEFSLQKQGSDWCRAFVSYDGVTLGRLNFEPCGDGHTLYGLKHYKSSDYEYEDQDEFFYQFSIWSETGKIISMRPLVTKAINNKLKDLAHKKQWRIDNPSQKKRRPLDKNYMGELRKLVCNELTKLVCNELTKLVCNELTKLVCNERESVEC
jgi:hypothetical protein